MTEHHTGHPTAEHARIPSQIPGGRSHFSRENFREAEYGENLHRKLCHSSSSVNSFTYIDIYVYSPNFGHHRGNGLANFTKNSRNNVALL